MANTAAMIRMLTAGWRRSSPGRPSRDQARVRMTVPNATVMKKPPARVHTSPQPPRVPRRTSAIPVRAAIKERRFRVDKLFLLMLYLLNILAYHELAER